MGSGTADRRRVGPCRGVSKPTVNGRFAASDPREPRACREGAEHRGLPWESQNRSFLQADPEGSFMILIEDVTAVSWRCVRFVPVTDVWPNDAVVAGAWAAGG